MNTYLLNYAKNLFETNNLISKRKIGFIEDYVNFSPDLIKKIINIDNYHYEIIKKINTEGYYMNWHFDNAKIITHKKNVNKDDIYDQILISDRHGIYYYLKKPVYSLIIYDSTYNNDFIGGILEFIDGTKIYPRKGMYVLFDSNELHKVSKIISGIRVNFLIKFYNNTNI
jgi:hypothetical protein